MTAWAYMLLCADGKYYVGSHRGEDVVSRVGEHQSGVNPKAYTFKRRPVELVWCENFEQIIDAIAAERRIKGWTRAKKEALIRGDWKTISALSRGPNYKPPPSYDERFDKLRAEEEARRTAGPPRPSTSSG